MTRVSARDMYEMNENIRDQKVELANVLNDLRSVQRIVHGRVSNITAAQEKAMMRDTIDRFNRIMKEAGDFFTTHSTKEDLEGFVKTIKILNEEIKSKFLGKHESLWERILRFFGRGRERTQEERAPQFDIATLSQLVKDRAMRIKNANTLNTTDKEALIDGASIEETEAYYLLFREHFSGSCYALFATEKKNRFILLILQADEAPVRHIITREKSRWNVIKREGDSWIRDGESFDSIGNLAQDKGADISYNLDLPVVAERREKEAQRIGIEPQNPNRPRRNP